MLGLLAQLRELILALEAQVQALLAELATRVQDQPLPKGLGALTFVTLEGEVCDWGRFSNRKQLGSYTGCCPGEHSSGGHRRVGAIDRMGNGRMRGLLVEVVWRFRRWQPQWQAAQRTKVKLADGTSMRKQTSWRRRTSLCTLAELGWEAA